ncbi:MAG: hypothetical protein ACPGVP_13800 [Thiolinea sp.]
MTTTQQTTSGYTKWRHKWAAWSLVISIFSTILADLHPDIPSFKSFWPSGVFALAAALLLLPDTGRAQRIQLGVLIVLGLILLIVGVANGAEMHWPELLSQNTGLITMVLMVGLLKLVITDQIVVAEKLPIGRKAYLQTLLSLSVFGSVINISAPLLIADRLSLNRPLDYFSAGTVVRMFSLCSSWSPFFAGTAVVLTAVGEIKLSGLMLGGLPLMLSAIAVLYWGGLIVKREQVEQFHGYPLKPDSLRIPILLSAMVFVAYMVIPELSILTLIALSSLVLTVGEMIVRKGMIHARDRLHEHIETQLPRSLNEVQLFLSAGILASGLQSLVKIGWLETPIDEFTGTTACLLLASIIILAALGIHPIIQIVAFTPLILTSNPNPELLGLTYLFGWALGTCGSPLSGTNLVMQGRFGIVAWRGAVQNWPYIAIMYCIACVVLLVYSS